MTNIETIRKFAAQVVMSQEIELGSPLIIDEISFIPIVKVKPPQQEREYLSLSEALEEGVCKVIDKGTEVAHILIENTGDLPILIEEGDIFQGRGTQDRICIGTVMVEPKTTVEIPVKCVHAPHHLSRGANFLYGGKASQEMMREMRDMKFKQAEYFEPVSRISQERVWSAVRKENVQAGIPDKTKYMMNIESRRGRARSRTKKLNFPTNTIGVAAVNADGEVKGLEIYRSPHNFKVRKNRIFESFDTHISWKPKGKGPFQDAQKPVINLFKKISELKEGEEARKQVEIDGLTINMAGIYGEAYTTTFYPNMCPKCNAKKHRKKVCPHCGFSEEKSEVIAYMSMY